MVRRCETQQRQINKVNVSQKYINTETNVITTAAMLTLRRTYGNALRNCANRCHFWVLFSSAFCFSGPKKYIFEIFQDDCGYGSNKDAVRIN